MTKRLAAAVLCAIVNLMGSQDAGAMTPDVSDDDGGIDCVEFRHDHDSLQRAPTALDAASALCGGEIDHAWVLRHHSGPGAAVAVQCNDLQHTAVVSLSVDVSILPWQPLLDRSLAFCREHDALKVIIEAQGATPAQIRMVAEADGFQFSRLRQVDGVDVAEFYTDLYRRDNGPRPSAS
jgi:hypothetical protein